MAGWTSLPSEVVREIVHLVVASTPESACDLASISRGWQECVEEKTFASLRIRSTQMQQLRDIVTPLRQSYVRQMTFEVVLPKYDAKLLAWRKETPDEQQLNKRAFTHAILPFLNAIASWNAPAGGKHKQRPGISFRIKASCPSDKVPDRYGVLRRRYKRWDNSILEILQDSSHKIPLLPAISEFLCGNGLYSRKLSPKTCCDIAAQMPNVHTLDWNLAENERSDLARRIQMRQDFAAGLQIIPASVRHFTLYHGPRAPNTHTWDPHRLESGNQDSHDPLSVALRSLSQRLYTLTIDNATVSPEVFWPVSPSSPRLPSPDEVGDFPHLEKVTVRLNEVTPAGEWFFTGHYAPAGEEAGNSDDSDIFIKPDSHSWFRCKLDPKVAEPYFLAAARAAQHMPKLKEFFLEWMATPLPCGLEYKVSNHEGPRAVLTLWGSPPVEPSLELAEAWGKVTETLLGSPELMRIERQDEGRVFEPI
ncbi:hypothetical protein E8E14_011322 [Neopestalotiopsis sp. 37M]|nr:hypothetical protein E8E14_011322 [Neopestalotiopsis sp. 37M]